MSAKTAAEADEILARFSRDVARHYGAALAGVYLFGNRARGDFEPGSDADVAVVIRQLPIECRIRDELLAQGIALKDNKDGTTTWEAKR